MFLYYSKTTLKSKHDGKRNEIVFWNVGRVSKTSDFGSAIASAYSNGAASLSHGKRSSLEKEAPVFREYGLQAFSVPLD
jgi:hypothetical protein